MKKIIFVIIVVIALFNIHWMFGRLNDRPGAIQRQGHMNQSFSDSLPRTITELGEQLFFDPILSKDNSISCASCHNPEFAFGDNKALSVGVDGKLTRRNTPSIMYLNLSFVVFWDGRAQTPEHQAFFPITNPDEMGLEQPKAIERLNNDRHYREAFNKLFNDKATIENISLALATFQRSLTFYNSPYDRFYLGNDTAISKDAVNGLALFIGKARCFHCHQIGTGILEAESIKNIGLYNGREYNDRGRFDITKDSADLGRFKVPLLRNIALTAPYMHDGSIKTLKEVIDFYDHPSLLVKNIINMDTAMRDSLSLTPKEKDDLLALMMSFTDDSLQEKLSRYSRRSIDMIDEKKRKK